MLCPLLSDLHPCLDSSCSTVELSDSSIFVYNFLCKYLPNLLPRDSKFDSLPGQYTFIAGKCDSVPDYDLDCVQAYNNINRVVDFIQRFALEQQKLQQYIASINCVQLPTSPSEQDWYWHPAAWIPWKKQAIFGEYTHDGTRRSVAILPDVVAHEFCHGLINHNCGRRLGVRESAALEESLCDIFAIIVVNSNLNQPLEDQPIINWNWKIGRDVYGSGSVLRDPSSPPSSDNPNFNQLGHPLHREGYLNVAQCHENSNIYSRAMYLWLTAQDDSGNALFNASFAANLFFATLEKLAIGVDFDNCATTMYSIAKKFLREDGDRTQKLRTIQGALYSVGINLNPFSSF